MVSELLENIISSSTLVKTIPYRKYTYLRTLFFSSAFTIPAIPSLSISRGKRVEEKIFTAAVERIMKLELTPPHLQHNILQSTYVESSG